jgi:hypothetical protein
MKSVIVEGQNATTAALALTKIPAKPIVVVLDLGPDHANCVRVVFANDADADAALAAGRLEDCFVLHDSALKYGLGGSIIYMHPDAPTPK